MLLQYSNGLDIDCQEKKTYSISRRMKTVLMDVAIMLSFLRFFCGWRIKISSALHSIDDFYRRLFKLAFQSVRKGVDCPLRCCLKWRSSSLFMSEVNMEHKIDKQINVAYAVMQMLRWSFIVKRELSCITFLLSPMVTIFGY